MSEGNVQYKSHTWDKGDLISSLKLNEMEAGISNSLTRILNIENAIDDLDYTDADSNTSTFISKVTLTNGLIEATHTAFSPTITCSAGTAEAAPGYSITVNSNSSGDPALITVATTDLNVEVIQGQQYRYDSGIYGVTTLCTETTLQNNKTLVTKAVTPKGLWNAINTLNKADSTDRSGSYVQKVTETNGIINYTHNDLSPQISWNTPTTETGEGNSDKPRLTISVGGISSDATADAPVASTTLYGVTKLNNTNSSSDQSTAATPKCVYDAIHTLISGGTLDANLTPTTMTVGTNDTHLATTAFVVAEIANNVKTSVPLNAVFTDTTYTFANGTNSFTVTPSNGTAQTVTITPSFANASDSAAGLMSSSHYTKLEGIASGANNYTHPSYTAVTEGLYKITVDSLGHISATSAASLSDLNAASAIDPSFTISATNGKITITDEADPEHPIEFTAQDIKDLYELIHPNTP